MYVPIAIVPIIPCPVSTGVAIMRISLSTEPNSGVTGKTVVFLVTYDTDSCFAIGSRIETFPVTISL